jgi:hypothetical protein
MANLPTPTLPTHSPLVDLGPLAAVVLPAPVSILSSDAVRLASLRGTRQCLDSCQDGRLLELKCGAAGLQLPLVNLLRRAGRPVMMLLNLGSGALIARRFPQRG